MPSPVDKYFKQVKKDNPSYSDEQAWATAWSIYCKHKSPGSEHCHKPADEYLKGKKAGLVVRVASRFKEDAEPSLAERVASRFKMAADFSQEELAILSIMEGIKPSYRAKDMDRAGLGEYNQDNPHIESLIKKGLIKVQGGKALTLDKAKAQKVMKEHPVPDKYKSHLTNPHMQFKRREE